MKTVTFYQELIDNNDGRIKYTTSDISPEVKSMNYSKFIDLINLWCKDIKNRGDFYKEINTYKTIHLIIETGEWSIINVPVEKNSFSFKDRIDALEKENEEKNKSKENRRINRHKKFIDQSFKTKYKDVKEKWRSK